MDAAPRILEIRGQRVLLDSDLAALYGVTTRRLNEQVRRNADRFPADFLLELTIPLHEGEEPKRNSVPVVGSSNLDNAAHIARDLETRLAENDVRSTSVPCEGYWEYGEQFRPKSVAH